MVDSSSFLETVKRVALVADRNTPLRLTFEEGQVIVEAGTGDEAQAVESLTCTYSGEPLTIAFNPQFLQEGVGALVGEHTEISFTTPTKPAVIAGRSDADKPSDGATGTSIMPGATFRLTVRGTR